VGGPEGLHERHKYRSWKLPQFEDNVKELLSLATGRERKSDYQRVLQESDGDGGKEWKEEDGVDI
jgi:hypothetical protein